MKKLIPSTYILGPKDLEKLGIKGKLKFAQATFDSETERTSYNGGARAQRAFDAVLIQIDEETEV